MSLRRLPKHRIPLLRPHRPPNISRASPTPRLFTQNAQLLLIATHNPRPQIPFLSQPTSLRRGDPAARFLSTDQKRAFRDGAITASKWAVYTWVFMFLGSMIYTGVGMEMRERANPTPTEWTFWSRHGIQVVRNMIAGRGEKRAGLVDWPEIGRVIKDVLKRLEDPQTDGAGLQEPADGEAILIPDLGKAGFDISGKSYEWRTCYYEVIMSCALAAEHLDDMVRDTTRDMVFPKDVVIGPSNPDPRPTTVYMASAPQEQNCEPAFEPPETYYMRVLTGRGFTTRQKVDTALAYANWLEFKGLHESAEEMYKWGVDIAKAALPVPAETVMEQGAVLKADSSANATPNLLRAVTFLAIHQARCGDLASALPSLLSVLRARRTAPVAPYSAAYEPSSEPSAASTDIGRVIEISRKIFRTPKFAPPPASGDDPLTRISDKPTCEESELMLYIGEILFATSPQSADGLGWTRQAVEIADANAKAASGATSNSAPREAEMRKCKECLLTGVENWERMLGQLVAQNMSASSREGARDAGFWEWRGWFGAGGGAKGKTIDELESGLMQEELKQVGLLRERIINDGISEEMLRGRGQVSGGTWMIG